MIEGTALTPARVAAMTNDDWAAFSVDLRRFSSLEGTIIPTMKIERTMRIN